MDVGARTFRGDWDGPFALGIVRRLNETFRGGGKGMALSWEIPGFIGTILVQGIIKTPVGEGVTRVEEGLV